MKKLAYISFVVLLTTSCGSDFFSTTLEVDPPEFENLMVIDGHFDNFSSFSWVRVSRTFPSIDPQNADTTLLNDAVVRLYEEGQLIKEFDNQPDDRPGFNFTSRANMDWQAGNTYKLEVEHPEYGISESTQVFPDRVPLDTVRFIENGGVDIDGYEVSRVEIEFTDPGDSENFYAVGLIFIDPVNGAYYYFDFISLDPLAEDDADYNDLLFPDQGFNGKKYQINLTTDRFNADDIKRSGYVVFKTITEDYYQYSITLRSAVEDSDFAGFSEPALVHSNFQNGLGCFTLTQIDIYPLNR